MTTAIVSRNAVASHCAARAGMSSSVMNVGIMTVTAVSLRIVMKPPTARIAMIGTVRDAAVGLCRWSTAAPSPPIDIVGAPGDHTGESSDGRADARGREHECRRGRG